MTPKGPALLIDIFGSVQAEYIGQSCLKAQSDGSESIYWMAPVHRAGEYSSNAPLIDASPFAGCRENSLGNFLTRIFFEIGQPYFAKLSLVHAQAVHRA